MKITTFSANLARAKLRIVPALLAAIGGAGSLLVVPRNAMADCVVTQPNQFLFTCAVNTTTSPTGNVIATGSTSASSYGSFGTGVDVVINPGVVVNGNGLKFSITTASAETITNNGAAINTNTRDLGPFDTSNRGLSFFNSGTGSVSYVGNGSASSVVGFGLSIGGNSVQIGAPGTPVVPDFSGPSGIASGGLNVGGSAVSAYFSGGRIAGGLQLAQYGFDRPATLGLTGHTTITANTSNIAIFTAGPVILNSDANIGDANRRVGTGISAISWAGGLVRNVNPVPIDITLGAGSSIYATTAGISAVSSDPTGRVSVTTNGLISVARGPGIAAIANVSTGRSNVAVSHNGVITTAGGGSEEVGIAAIARKPGDVAVNVTGSITTSRAAASIGIGAAATTGNVTVDIANGASINAGGTGIVADASSGGTVTINNRGTVSGLFAARFTGTMNVGNGGSTGTIIGNILDRGTLNFNRSDAVTYSGVISDTGRVQQVGTGLLTLAGVNTYTGATNVNAGTLNVTGSIASSLLTTVNAGATLGGTGVVGNTTITGGTFAPGNGTAGSSMTVTGSLTLTAAATYLVQINPTTASFANVAGSATLGGATVNAVYANGSYVSRRYAILSAGSRSGTFNALVNTNLPTNFSSSLSYDATNAYLDLKLNFSVPGGLNQNQQNVANALTNFFTTTGGIPLAFAALSPAGLTLASGELGVGTQQATFDAMNLFMGLLTDPFVSGRGESAPSPGGPAAFADDALAYAANGKRPATASERAAYAAIYRKAPPLAAPSFEQRWSVWSAGYGGSQTTDGNAALGSNTTTSRVAAGVVGLDYRLSPNTLVGIALAGGGTGYSLAGGLGSGRSDLFQAGAYLRHTIGASYLTAALAYGWQDVTTERVVGADRLNARFTTDTVSGRIEGGHRFATSWFGGIGITPYAAGQFTTISLPTYTESPGVATTFGLSYAARDVTASRSELGLRSDKSFIVQDGVLTLRGRAAWAHNFNPDRSIGATFQALPGASFVVNGAAQARDAALVTASAEMKWRNNWSVAATFEGEFSDVTSSYAGKGVVRYAW